MQTSCSAWFCRRLNRRAGSGLRRSALAGDDGVISFNQTFTGGGFPRSSGALRAGILLFKHAA